MGIYAKKSSSVTACAPSGALLGGDFEKPKPAFASSSSAISSGVLSMDFTPRGNQDLHIFRRPCRGDMRLELLHPHCDLAHLRVAEFGQAVHRIGASER